MIKNASPNSRWMLALAFVSVFIHLLPNLSQAEDDGTTNSLHFLGSVPQCGTYRYSGAVKELIVSNTYCDRLFPNGKSSDLVSIMEKALDGKTIRRAYLAFFAISDPRITKILCDHLDYNTTTVIAGTRRGRLGDLRGIETCARDVIVPNVTIFDRGNDEYITSFHLKIMGLEMNDGSFFSISGSLNPTKGHENNIDYFFYAEEDTLAHPFFDISACVVKAFAVEPVDRFQGRLSKRRIGDCSSSGVVSLQNYGIESFMLPSDRDFLLPEIAFNFSHFDAVKIYTQAGDYDVFSSIAEKAIGAGKKVAVTMDDDTYFFHVNPAGRDLRSYMSDEREEADFLLPLLNAGAEFRFVMTNHHDNATGERNFLHAKMITFWKGGILELALIGSANLTWAAYNSNAEMVYLVSARQMLDEIASFSRAIDERSVPFNEMPRRDARPLRQ